MHQIRRVRAGAADARLGEPGAGASALAVSAPYAAAYAVEHGTPESNTAECLVKATCADAFRRVAGDAIQIPGGLGFTWEPKCVSP